MSYLPERMGSATLEPNAPVVAGDFTSLTLTYTAGYFGIDDTGSLKIVSRFASDMGKPQFSDPAAPNFVTVEASNGAVLDVRYDGKLNTRPWDKTLYIKVVRGFLRQGDRIVVRYGDPRQGSPGMRMQTFCEATFEFKVLVDAFAAYRYVELPSSPTIAIVAGPPANWKAVLPTVRRAGEPFRLCVVAEDRWGNPTGTTDATFVPVVRSDGTNAVANLPAMLRIAPGAFTAIAENLSVAEPGDLTIDLEDAKTGKRLCSSNPLRIVAETPLLPYWSDLHGQSEETIGTNSARDFFAFARDRAFLDACSHQGNDFQITTPFWKHLNDLTQQFNRDGSFIAFPGYEWSGNTGLGGDRNVLFRREGRQIHRSSHALLDDLSDVKTDANSAEDLFRALEKKDCIVFAHIGGRYADIKMSHDVRLERSVEVHSAWGTFDWLIHDAFEKGYRVGIVSNSDGHKGRPGASYPGASLFGAYGGLTCILAEALSRDALLDALRRRHNYGTTGCRALLDVRAAFEAPATRFRDDPNLGTSPSENASQAMMGDILRSDAQAVTLTVEIVAPSPVERIELYNGLELLETYRPFEATGRRVRVVWEGSEYRGRGRETVWDGTATFAGVRVERTAPINFYNLDKRLVQHSPTGIAWQALTTGGHGGFDAWLDGSADDAGATLAIDTALVQCEVPLATLTHEDAIFDAGGLSRRLRVFRLPEENAHRHVALRRTIPLRKSGDNALYARATLENGHVLWSSPIYVFA